MNWRAEQAWADFKRTVEELGGTVIELEWQGARKPHRVICAAGHACKPRPNDIQQGQGICRICAGCSPIIAEQYFRERLKELCAFPLYESWRGVRESHHVRCSRGHDCYPRPNDVQQGKGICLACVGNDSATAEANFRARLNELKAASLFTVWLGNGKPHHVQCSRGHDCWPRPSNVQQGQGICPTCSCLSQDIFYVVGSLHGDVKLGISSGNPKVRLNEHRRRGFVETLFIKAALPLGLARTTEIRILRELRQNDYTPSWGNEYFSSNARDFILALVTEYLSDKAIKTYEPIGV